MENILQSVVKIIIIGSLYTSTNVDGNRQFLPPPLPYYQNDDYFLPGFVPPYYDPVPVYYREPPPPPPISYQNVNSYTPSQLFHRNENYNPAQLANPVNPSIIQPMPHIFHHKPNPYQPFEKEQKNNFVPPRVNYKKPSLVQAVSHTENSHKKPAFYATNIIVKEESQPSYYQDEFNKNYHEEDYTDNYSDDSPTPQEPCPLNSPYRYFESPKANPNDPNVDRLTLCNPYFQPNFGNNAYTVKMPITLLPSRFPPRVEQLIERIQNYFSTYTQQGTQKPENETTTAIQPAVTEATSQTEAPITPMITTGDTNKRNTSTEIEELTLVETNSEPSEATAVGTPAVAAVGTPAAAAVDSPAVAAVDSPAVAAVGTPAAAANEQVTQKTIVVKIEATDEEPFSTDAPETHIEAHIEKVTPIAVQTIQTANEVSEKVVDATYWPYNYGEVLQTSEQIFPTALVQNAEGGASSEKTLENQISNEWSFNNATGDTPATKTHPVDVKAATESSATDISNKTEESNAIHPTKETLFEVTDKNG